MLHCTRHCWERREIKLAVVRALVNERENLLHLLAMEGTQIDGKIAKKHEMSFQ
jgi:hypothetical protein